MNNFKLAWKLFSIYPTKERFNFALIVPFLGIIIGVFLLLITLGVMEGMEKTIYTDIRKFISTEKIIFLTLFFLINVSRRLVAITLSLKYFLLFIF